MVIAVIPEVQFHEMIFDLSQMKGDERVSVLGSSYKSLVEGCKDIDATSSDEQEWARFISECGIFAAALHVFEDVPIPYEDAIKIL